MFDKNLVGFEKKIWLAAPTMHGDEMRYIADAYNESIDEGKAACMPVM